MLVIEIDGVYHFEEEQKIKDNHRQNKPEDIGLNFIRFSEQQIRKDMDIVLIAIGNYITEYEKKTIKRSTGKRSNTTTL